MKPSAVLTADWHVRSSTPKCRTDNFLKAQECKVDFVVELAKKYDCPILIAGDIGDKDQWSNELLEWFTQILIDVNVIAIPGQHDLPDHSLKEIKRSGTGVLTASETIDVRDSTYVTIENDFNLISFPFSKPLRHFKINRESGDYPKVAMTHQMIVKNAPLWKGQKDPKSRQILRRYPEYNLILSGDNHNAFRVKYKGRLLVNPGSLMRTNAAQVNHRPRVYLWYAKTNTVKPIYIPIKDGVISREHIEEKDEQKERMGTYVERMKADYDLSISFEDNLERRIKLDKVRKKVERKIWENVN